MASKVYYKGIGKFRLTNFYDSEVIEIDNKDGVPVKGVFIPLGANDLKETSGGNVDAFFFINSSMIASSRGWTHFFVPARSKEYYYKMKELGYKLPVLGQMKGYKGFKFEGDKSSSVEEKEIRKVKASDYE